MLIKNIENKIKLTLFIALSTLIICCIIVISVLFFAYKTVQNDRKNVYILENGIPEVAEQSKEEATFEIEAKGDINNFHTLFFTLPPDDDFMKKNIEKAMYLIDESGLKQYNNLKEAGFYNSILANSMYLSIKTDSIVLQLTPEKQFEFTYYGTQRIERQTTILKRIIITSGYIHRVQRSDNNPYGLMITNWKTLKNEDVEIKTKKVF